MTVGSPNPDLAKDVRTLFQLGVVANLSDGQLLERFAAGRDGNGSAEAAFTELVRRHGSMVHRVCRSILNESHDTQDAVQATFLVLVRKAGSVRRRESIASWLHGTALRVARRTRGDAARRQVRERLGAVNEAIDTEIDSGQKEGWPELHEELARLPEKYRVPLVLCYLEGMTTEVAARQLGCPQGTILCRLSRGRERLKGRLIRRGLTASAALLSLERSSDVSASAAMSAGSVTSTVRAALQFAAERSSAVTAEVVSARGLALAKGVLRTMLMAKLKLLGVVVLAGAVVAVAPASLLMRTQAKAQQSLEARPVAKAAKPDDRWVKKLPSGATVELVGISTYPSGPKTWWSPDGSPLRETPYASGGASIKAGANQQARVFAVRLKDLPDKVAEHRWQNNYQFMNFSGKGELLDQVGGVIPGLETIAFALPGKLASCSIEFGIAARPWKVEATCGPDGRAAETPEDHRIILGPTHESQGKTIISVCHNDLNLGIRVVAIDLRGKTHTPDRVILLSSEEIIQQTLTFSLSLEAIKEFQFQTQLYEWAEFKDVPLQPPAAAQIKP